MATGSAIASAGIGIFQTVQGAKRVKEANQALRNFKRQDLVNPFGNLQVSTLKSEQQTDANLSSFATSVDALQRGGTRAVLGGLPRLNEANILVQNQISQDLENQDIQRKILFAQGEERIRAIQEGREIDALQGIGQQLQTGRQDIMSGASNVLSSALAISSATDPDKGGEKK